ncbi:TIM barrel protein [Paracoccus sp. 1_MG-2023]|uniref:sugar phosphate isomerase/epimerase family protein n=1 Tax=unclassified Paracoccus (in: a-proteobacteria) TaxID=2688777 RepID=UPI001C0A2CD0|nr:MULTISPECIES: TIM barrel protein [unclassified Paracoccus (in: a-proteobacteria)]MBU2957852.1 sugar phosphate isomerase/epimerase [Paracoccus sp. C2R09]MDO6667300.1 TIM barrel protein [Paracoccus sp. 1_MG-2023]
MTHAPSVTVFTKPWTEPLETLAPKLARLGFEGVELAVRTGYQVAPDRVAQDLPAAVRLLADHGLATPSIAGDIDAATIAACGEAGVRMIRICAPIDMGIGYRASVDRYRASFDRVLPMLERAGVCIGVQNHSGTHVASAVGLAHLLERYDPQLVCGVLDMAHCAVDGEPVDMAVDIAWPLLNGLVNFKSACHLRATGPEEQARYEVHWTTHDHGGYDWADLVAALHARGYRGSFCMPAEYNAQAGRHGQRMGDDVIPMLTRDLAHLRMLRDRAWGTATQDRA